MFKNAFANLQKVGKSLMLPVSVLPIAGILLGARVLRLKYRLGLFDNPYWDIKKYDKFGSKESLQTCH